jgi:hypothetical protein
VTNPYRAPEAAVADQDRPRGSPAKAVTFGVLVDIVGSTIAGGVLMFVYAIVLAVGGAPAEEIEQAATVIDPGSNISLIGYAIGLGFSFLGGYVCARTVRHAELKWASITALISISIGFAIGLAAYPLELNVLMAILGICAIMAGGQVGARQNLKG